MSIDALFRQVREFHKIMDQPHPDVPTMQTIDLVRRRSAWIISEVVELNEAETVEDQADAYIDIAYFSLGGLVELGVIPGALWAAAHGANMAKVWPDGFPRKQPDGKIIKPPGWVDPTPAQKAEVVRQLIEMPLRFNAEEAA